MKCLVCDREIDELREFASAVDAAGKLVEDALGKLRHQQELARWVHVGLTAQTAGGSVSVFSGHVCPAHDLGDLSLAAPPKEDDR